MKTCAISISGKAITSLCSDPGRQVLSLTNIKYFDTLNPVKSKFFAKEVHSNVNSFKHFRAVSAYERACTLDLVPESETMPTGALTPSVVLF
jgi:hypothetical protein